jgi:primary-amine oxidase
MKCSLSIALGLAALNSFTEAQNASTTDRQSTVSAPHSNPWKTLSDDEAASVNALLQAKMSLTGDFGSSNDSYVLVHHLLPSSYILTISRYQLALLPPNKTDIVSFLDANATASKRYARATVQIGATNSSDMYWQEYMVGPLPATNGTVIEPLTYPFDNSQPGRITVHPVYIPNDGANFLTKFSADVEDISVALFNTVSLTFKRRYMREFHD